MPRPPSKVTTPRRRPPTRTAPAPMGPPLTVAAPRPQPSWKRLLVSPGGRARTSTVLALAASVMVLLTGFALTMAAAAPPDAVVTVTFTTDDKGFTATSTKDITNVWVELCGLGNHKHDNLTGKSYTHSELVVILGVWVKSGNNGGGPGSPPGSGERFDNEGASCIPTATTTPPETSVSASVTVSLSVSISASIATSSSTSPTTEATTETTQTTPPETTETTSPTTETTTPQTTQTTPPETTETTKTTETTSPETTETTKTSETTPLTTETTTSPVQTTASTRPPPSTEIPVFPSAGALALGLAGALGSAFVAFRRRP